MSSFKRLLKISFKAENLLKIFFKKGKEGTKTKLKKLLLTSSARLLYYSY